MKCSLNMCYSVVYESKVTSMHLLSAHVAPDDVHNTLVMGWSFHTACARVSHRHMHVLGRLIKLSNVRPFRDFRARPGHVQCALALLLHG